MYFYIKEWSNKTATLMTEDGVVLWTYPSVDAARKVWSEWYNIQQDRMNYHLGFIRESGVSECELA